MTIIKRTVYECGCVTQWRVDPLEPTPLTCPVHGSIWTGTTSAPVGFSGEPVEADQ